MSHRPLKVFSRRPEPGAAVTAPQRELSPEVTQAQPQGARAEPQDFPDPDPLLDVPTTERLLGVSRSSLFELLRAGHLPAVKLGRRTLIRTSDLSRFIANLASAQYRQPHITPLPKRGRPYGR
jgi:excisionase family DNA binding protein